MCLRIEHQVNVLGVSVLIGCKTAGYYLLMWSAQTTILVAVLFSSGQGEEVEGEMFIVAGVVNSYITLEKHKVCY